MGFCEPVSASDYGWLRFAWVSLGALLGKFQECVYQVTDLTERDVLERVAIFTLHLHDGSIYGIKVHQYFHAVVDMLLHHLVIGIKRVAVIGLMFEMRENHLSDFPFDAGGEHLLLTIGKGLFGFGHGVSFC
jgi:hypothetical protein